MLHSRAFTRWVLLAGVAGMIANLFLTMYYALGIPWRSTVGFGWVGPVNDSMAAVQYGALMPVAVGVRHRLGDSRRIRRVTAMAIAAMGTFVVLQVLLVADILPFSIEIGPASACLALSFVWLLVVTRTALRTGALSPGLARLGSRMAAGYLIGAAIAALSLLLPWGSVGQYAVFGVGVVIGLFGWFGFPVWLLLLARHSARLKLPAPR